MLGVSIIGIGQTIVGEHWDFSWRDLVIEAGTVALRDAGSPQIDALFVANAYASVFNQQSQMGALIADLLGLQGIEAYTVEAADASGGVALRAALLALASGQIKTAMVLGIEKTTDLMGPDRDRARSISLDAEFEALQGATLASMAALLMCRYMYEYDLSLEVFEGFSINAHANGRLNPYAMYRNLLRSGSFQHAPMVADPVNLFDMAPDGDGAAALILTRTDLAADKVEKPIQIIGSSVSTDTLTLQERANPLILTAVAQSYQKALLQAQIKPDEIDLMEVHDAFTILTTLSLEAMGFAEKGKGWQLANEEVIGLKSKLPLSTMGGLKARGNPAGATGVYQAVEACLQLRSEAGPNQVSDAQYALIQSVGGLASTVATHILTNR
ncbi:thiolase domain-containing protein [Anaerolineales bacterium]